MHGQTIVLSLMLLMNVFTAIALIMRIVNPDLPKSQSTPGSYMLSLFITLLMAAGAVYLAAH